ncbi:MAG: hypothetical protein NT099_00950 [Candidatus Saganbacteria bacterium]|nr:hypothetical protein [Candidatus Saganbacteria bacterium]
MGFRTCLEGLRRGEVKEFFRSRDFDNRYLSYAFLLKMLTENPNHPQALENLTRKVNEGFVSLEELISGDRATEAFKKAGLFEWAVQVLTQRRAVVLNRDGAKMQKFLASGAKSVPYVVEHVPAADLARDLAALSTKVEQRSVVDLTKTYERTNHYERDTVVSLAYELQYDDRPIVTGFLPYPIQNILAFPRDPKQVVAINRGLVITDRFVSNLPQLLDALAKLKCSPLDCILVHLRSLGGLVYPTRTSLVQSYPNATLEEFAARDHFTEQVRMVLQDEVAKKFAQMQAEDANPLSFRVYIRRTSGDQGKQLYVVDIMWHKKA